MELLTVGEVVGAVTLGLAVVVLVGDVGDDVRAASLALHVVRVELVVGASGVVVDGVGMLRRGDLPGLGGELDGDWRVSPTLLVARGGPRCVLRDRGRGRTHCSGTLRLSFLGWK